ncbi:hypothetical protein QJS04_geneDACA005949 [Acorus gramineus]|uniref:Exocyst subunit Exo70 family protein n=1 Tax=Acorus gramineus TaxID=55184 RepID=A0AAV9B5V1_ACOGR|nr:hypothetical protein QJS04_geneDACA005949 [Acorus gramineus]
MASEENGEEKLLAVARHIAKTLGRTDTMADDILQIFSTFDGRFSREKLSDTSPASASGGALDDDGDERIDRVLRSLDRRISRFVASDRPIWSDAGDASAFLDSVDALLSLMGDLDPSISSDKPLIDRSEDLLQQAMFRLEDEFRSLMEGNVESTDLIDSDPDNDDSSDNEIPTAYPVSVSDMDSLTIDALPSGTVADLKTIADRMVSAGFWKEIAHVYSAARRDFLEISASRLGLRPLTVEEVQGTPWQDLEDETSRWVPAANLAFRVLFPSERRLVDRVFSSSSAAAASAADLAFMESCRILSVRLLSFADAVAIGPRAPERLFRAVDLYECLRDLQPGIRNLFSDRYSTAIASEAAAVCRRLADAIRGIFMELENLIRRDPVKAPVPGGGCHPITRYVMNYLRAACSSRGTLEQVFSAHEGTDDERRRSSSSLSVQVAWIMELLQSNLEAKSKVFKDVALSHIFLMNNFRYIAGKVRDNEDLAVLLGEDWVRRETAKIRQCLVNYQRTAWGKVGAVLRGDAAVGTLREKLRVFNVYFEEICRAQVGWVVADEKMREDVRGAIVGAVVPAYRGFLSRVGGEGVKYGWEEVEARINGLFQGSSSGGHGGTN